MRLRDPDDNGRRVKRQNKPIQPKRADKSKPVNRSGTDQSRRSERNESVRGDEAKIHGHRYRRRAEALDRDTEGTESNPSGAREQVRRAGGSSRSSTGGAPRFGSTDAAERVSASGASDVQPDEESSPSVHRYGSADAAERAASASIAENDGTRTDDHLVENPLEEEQRTDLPPDAEPFQAGSPQPEVPDFTGRTPTSRETNAAGRTTETFRDENGVTYTRSSYQGNVTTTYQREGVDYSSTTREDGTSEFEIDNKDENGGSTRTLEYGADGQLVTDRTHTSEITDDGYQVRQETVNADGTRTVEETVSRPDGGLATNVRVERPDGQISENYSYQGDQGTYTRTSDTTADGVTRTERQRGYQVDRPIEDLTGAPGVPELPPEPEIGFAQGRGAEPVATPLVTPFPETGRSPTEVLETEVEITGPNGETTVIQDETIYSQTSSDVGFRDPVYSSGDRQGHQMQTSPGTFPGRDQFTASPEDSSVTRTVRVGTVMGPDGQPIEVNEASQTVTVAGVRNSDGGEVSNTVTHTWNGQGESTSTYASQGYTRDEQVRNRGRVSVGGATVDLTAEASGKSPDQHLRDKGGREVENFLGVDYDEPVNSSVVITRDSSGEPLTETAVLSTVDDNGNGKTVTRHDPEDGPVSWTYADYDDDGRDYERQTVFEGSELSIYETHDGHQDGTFRSTTETRNGGDVIGESVTERRQLSASDIRTYAHHGEITASEADTLIAEGGPFFVDVATNRSDQVEDEPAIDFESTSFSAGSGYTLGYTSNTETQKSGEATRTSFRTVSDPDAEIPFQGDLRRETRGSESESFTLAESGPLTIDRQGTVRFRGEEISDGPAVPTDRDNLGFEDIVSYTSGAAAGLAENFQVDRVTPPTGLQKDPLTERINNPALERLGNFADIVSAYGAAHQVWDAVSAREISWDTARQYSEGVGGLATGGSAAADIVEALALRSARNSTGAAAAAGGRAAGIASNASKVSKVLGPVGAVVGGVLGAVDLFTADSGYDRAAAALGIAAAGAAFIPVVGWAASLVLGVASYVVGNGDQNNTAGVDERLRD